MSIHCSGVTRNFRQGVRQSVAFRSVHSHSAALCVGLYHWEITYTYQKIMYFPDGVRTPLMPLVWLRHWSTYPCFILVLYVFYTLCTTAISLFHCDNSCMHIHVCIQFLHRHLLLTFSVHSELHFSLCWVSYMYYTGLKQWHLFNCNIDVPHHSCVVRV